MLTQTEYNAQLRIGTNELDGTPTYNYNKMCRRKMYKDYIQMFKVYTDPDCMGCDVPRADWVVPIYAKAYEAIETACIPPERNTKPQPWTISLGDCKPAPTPLDPYNNLSDFIQVVSPKQQEQGNNPMYANKTTASYNAPFAVAGATIINAKSDETGQREYLLEELTQATCWHDPMNAKLRKMFNMDARTVPLSSAELIDAIKNGKYKVDQKKVDRNTAFFADDGDDGDYEDRYDDMDNYIGQMYYGITFTDLPVADHKGYDEARKEYETFKRNVKRTIIVGTPAEGLAALISLETWTPSNAPVTVH